MKTASDNESRERTEERFNTEAERLRDEALEKCPSEFDGATEAAYVEVNDELTEVIRQSLKKGVAYCVPSETFWGKLAEVLSFKAYATYQVKTKGGKTETQFVSWMDDAYQKQKQILGNLGYAFFVLAHLAKHYGSREAGEKFLRVASVSQRHERAMPIRFEDGQLDELIATAQDGVDALKVAADYAALCDWEAFRKGEAAKFAAEERRVAARKAKA